MTVEQFSDEWFGTRADLLRRVSAPGHRGVEGDIAWKVQTGPRQFATFVDSYAADGSVSSTRDDAGTEADCTIEIASARFDEIQDGTLDIVVAFMRGDLRLTGSRHVFFALAPVLRFC